MMSDSSSLDDGNISVAVAQSVMLIPVILVMVRQNVEYIVLSGAAPR